jgi:hypothetical protein
MNLVYVDESGNTGLNLKDSQQPVFILAAMIVLEHAWFILERDFFRTARGLFGADLAYPFEIHATDLKSGRRFFKDLPLERRLSFRDQMLQLLVDSEVVVIYRRIIKAKFEAFCVDHYGPGIKVNPYVMALPFVCMEVDHYLRHQGPDQLGMLIFDEQKENLDAVERSLRTLRLDSTSILKTTNIVEKGFFVDSSKSFALQLVDIAAYHIRKYEESKSGFRVNPLDAQTFGNLRKLISTGVGSDLIDVVEWVKNYFAK